jgi:hypothetical protein
MFVIALTNGYCEAMMHHIADVRPVVDILSPPPGSTIEPFDWLQRMENRLWELRAIWKDPPLQYAPLVGFEKFREEFRLCLTELEHPKSRSSRESSAVAVAQAKAAGLAASRGTASGSRGGALGSGVSPGHRDDSTAAVVVKAKAAEEQAAAVKAAAGVKAAEEQAAAVKAAQEQAAAAKAAEEQAAAAKAAEEQAAAAKAAEEQAAAGEAREELLGGILEQARACERFLAAILDRRQGDAAMLAESVAAECICAADPLGQTALHHAVRLRYFDVVQILCRRMPDLVNTFTNVDAKPSHWSPLHVVADMAVGSDLSVVNSIADCLIAVANQQALDGQTNKGATALMLSACRGHTHIVEQLLAARADVAVTDAGDKTAVDRCSRNHSGIAKLIAEHSGKHQRPLSSKKNHQTALTVQFPLALLFGCP